MEADDTEAIGRVRAAITEHRVLSLLEASVGLGIEAERAVIYRLETSGYSALDGNLVVILQVGANAWKVNQNLDVVLLKLSKLYAN